MSNQQGLGLPELLITLLLASLTTVMLMRHYLNVKQQYRHIQTALEQSIELQLVSDLIRGSARRAGFTPCLSIEHLTTTDQRDKQKKLFAIEIGKDGEPTLQINRMSDYFDMVLHIEGPTELLVTSTQPLHQHQSILLADCYHAEAQHIAQIRHTAAGQNITLTRPLAFTYHHPIYIGAWLEEIYSSHGQPRNKGTLFYHLHHTEELTRVVHNLSSRLEKHHGRTLLQVILDLDHAQRITLETLVRTV